jgi:hypothetical protein
MLKNCPAEFRARRTWREWRPSSLTRPFLLLPFSRLGPRTARPRAGDMLPKSNGAYILILYEHETWLYR